MSNWMVVFVIKSVYMIILLLSSFNSLFSVVKTKNLHRIFFWLTVNLAIGFRL